jgi:hypothetical protein
VSPAGRTRRPAGRAAARVLALVSAFDEEDTVGRTVTSLRQIGAVTEVVVLDDGSSDGTADEAARAGARVLRSPRNLGKGTVLEGALSRLDPAAAYLLVDADVGETASEAGKLLDPVLAGELDLAVGSLPALPGGLGSVKAMASWMIERVGTLRPAAPLSGQRAITREALEACRPLGPGFGLETAMTMDALRLGLRVAEIPLEMTHRLTGRSLPGFAHRGRQGWDILRVGTARLLGLR